MTVPMIMEGVIPEKMRKETDEAPMKSFINGLYIRRYRAKQKISQPKGNHQFLSPFANIYSDASALK